MTNQFKCPSKNTDLAVAGRVTLQATRYLDGVL